jgi:hypothetical protein
LRLFTGSSKAHRDTAASSRLKCKDAQLILHCCMHCCQSCMRCTSPTSAVQESGKLLALRQMLTAGLKPPVLVFVSSKERAKALHAELMYESVHVDSIHADQSQAARAAAITSFRKGTTWVLIATDLLARGMDFLGVQTVVNYDFPNTKTDYIHRRAASTVSMVPATRMVMVGTATAGPPLCSTSALLRACKAVCPRNSTRPSAACMMVNAPQLLPQLCKCQRGQHAWPTCMGWRACSIVCGRCSKNGAAA